MGHTHYWVRDLELPARKFAAAAKDCGKIMKHLKVALGGSDATGRPVYRADLIEFNGAAPGHYETFAVERTVTGRDGEEKVFQFCKTAHRPYDICVQAALIVLKHHLGEAITVSSDGDNFEWDGARAGCEKWLGYGGDFAVEK